MMRALLRQQALQSPESQRGFTIVELMIATTIFSFVLLIASSTAVQIGKRYYKTLAQIETQEVARAISEDLTRSFQFDSSGNGIVVGGSDPALYNKQFCVGDTRYTYSINKPIAGQDDIGFRVQRIFASDPCAKTGGQGRDYGKEILARNMRVLYFNKDTLAFTDEVYKLDFKIAFGDNDLLTHYNNDGTPNSSVSLQQATCKTGIAGSDFCAVAQLDNIVKKRLN
jgi:prepilin-type N-terminal cleavage/methylation domain-containing protein